MSPTAPSGRRIAIASFVGTAIEFYDFYIYGTAAALVFGAVFFPSFSPLAGGISPIVATDLLARTGSSAAVSAYVLVIALVCVAALLPLRETKDADFTDGLASTPIH